MSEQSSSPVIRVFVSSTFIDMQNERDLLVHRVFPDIRRRCAEKGIDFEAIDLRWGVSGESSDAQVLAYCLDQIKGCVPYLFAMIGGRYGWVPGNDPEITAVLEPDERGRSVTEIEIRRFESMVARTGQQKRLLVGLRSAALTQSLGVDETHETHARAQLEALRTELGGDNSAFEYADLATLETRVRDFFVAEAVSLAKQLDTPARQIDARQTTYLNLLRIPGVTRIPLPLAQPHEASNCIDETQLVERFEQERLHILLGGPGSGKTALCASLGARWLERDAARRVLRLHIGATGELSLNGVLRDLYQVADAGEPEDWADRLVQVLDTQARPTLIVLDGLERIIGWDQPLPSTLEVISHQPYQLLLTVDKLLKARSKPTVLLAFDPDAQRDNALGALLQERTLQLDSHAAAFAFTLTQIGSLDARMRADFATQFFSFRGKQLNRDHIASIAQAGQIGDLDTLYLACDRLRRFGELTMDKQAQDAFISARIVAVFQQAREQAVVAVVEEIRAASGLPLAKVDAILLLLAVSKYGLPATELIVVASNLSGQNITLRDWAVFEGMLGPLLARSSTRMQYKNAHTRSQVLSVLDSAALARARTALVDYLLVKVADAGLPGVFVTTVDAIYPNELAWQLRALPGHPGWRYLFSSLGLVAWFANDCEMALVEMNASFEAGSFEQAFTAAPSDDDEYGAIESFRSAARDFVTNANAGAALRFERALDWAKNALFLPEATSQGPALLAARAAACTLCLARQDTWPSADHCRSAVMSTVNLLTSVLELYGVRSRSVAPLRALLMELVHAAPRYAPKHAGPRASHYLEEIQMTATSVLENLRRGQGEA